jgi:DUF4097 and DUF4098 domain-containing protein YvlB
MRTRIVPLVILTLTTGLMAADVTAQTAPNPPISPAAPHSHSRNRAVVRYQGRGGPEQTERFSRKIKLGRNGWLTLSNIAGTIVVTGGAGDALMIEGVKRTRGDQSRLAGVRIDVDERSGRVEVRTVPTEPNLRVAVDYTVTVPADAGVELRSVSGDIKVTGVQGAVRAESVSGNVTAGRTPRLERAKSVSGDVDLTDVGADSDVSAGSVSGNLRATGFNARGLDFRTVSGDVVLTNVTCDRVDVRSVSGNIEFSGTLLKNARLNLGSHSGAVRLVLAGDAGFELSASSFSGSFRSDLPLTIGADTTGNDRTGGARDDRVRRDSRRGRSIRATYGDGSAWLSVRTFSGDVVIAKAK